MLIGIDASRAVRTRRTGTENYSLHLIRALLAKASVHRFRLYCDRPPAAGLLAADSRVDVLSMPSPRLWTQVRLAGEVAWRPPDVLFVPAHVVPLLCRPRAVVTIHDLGYLAFPEAHSGQSRFYLDWSTRFSVHRASLVIVPSGFTKLDLVSRLGVPEDKIAVVPEAVGPEFVPPANREQAAKVAARYGLRAPYVVALGTMQPRKNLPRLLRAFANARTEHSLPHQLALVGQAGWRADAIDASLGPLGLDNAVVRTGYVPEEDLPSLLGGADALAFPSLYEGFGLPALEAMACGVPVLAANSTSLPEVTDEAAVLVDPTDESALSAALGSLLTDDQLREDLSRRGLERARSFSWERAATETLAVLEAAASS